MNSTGPERVAVEWEEGARQVNECKYLFAESIRESQELTLELTLAEAKPQAEIQVSEDWNPIGELRIGGRSIETDLSCRVFHLIFDRNQMVLYMVLNESYGVYPADPEKFSGKLLRVFSWSHLLEFTKRTTIASDANPGVLQHYGIACLNHVIDVICTGPPRIFVDMGGAGSVQ
jgi:hypothetical protein